MVRRIVKGYAANRCRPCGHRHRRAAPTPEPPADTWRADAACLGADLGLFFGYGRDAIEICAGCQVRQQCLTEELSRGLADQWGIRGGTTPTERRAMLRQRTERRPARTCAVCGAGLSGRPPSGGGMPQRYCSDECRLTSKRRRQNEYDQRKREVGV